MAEALRQSWNDVPRWTYLRSRAEALAEALAHTPMARERPHSTGSFGSHGRRRAGVGDVFWQFRRYEQSDAATLIDWRQSAKSDRLFVRQREEEVAQTYWLWCDASDSMDFKSDAATETKADRAMILMLAAALFFLDRGERVGILGSGRKALSTRAAFSEILAMTKSGAPGDYGGIPIGGGYGRILLIGDFHEEDKKLETSLAIARRRGFNGFLLQVLDPAEIDFPFEGHVEFRDQESARREDVGRAEAMRALYMEEMTRWRDKLSAIAHASGWGYVRHRTDQDPLLALRAVAEFIASK
jgi:uncharacterized protein (DUF58 family)